ncbi:zinc finger protein 836 [Neodiprion virginianus]|uniref:zinc finger protein 836 n=1 Tax=Neodiprion virginianus TaxID=2961670 RepID=UPI001EE7495F|nr:zinc finger protein 836 [Neodiprion virginianus]
MCAKLLACPLCSQPAFLTLDALRAGLISVATRPLACPVCNEVLLGVDKLTIHLFSHTINFSNDHNARNGISSVIDNQKNLRNEEDVDHTTIHNWNVINKTIGSQHDFPNVKSLPKSQNQIVPSTTTTNQVIFLQTLPQLQSATLSRNVNNSVGEEIYMQSIMPAGESATQQTSSGFSNDKLKQCVENSLTNSSKSEKVDENCRKKILQFQPIWSDNFLLSKEINSAIEEANSSEIVTVSSKVLPKTDIEVLLESVAKGKDVNEAETMKTENSEKEQGSSEQCQVSPQIKSLKPLATKEKTERCDICGVYFSDQNILTLHKQLVHMINEKDLNRKSEDLLKNYPCHLCPKVFKMRGSLMVHMRVAHIGFNLGSLPKEGDAFPMPGEHGYNCPTCGKLFKKEQHVTQHLKTHEGKQWECDVCSKMFTTKYFLKKHKRLHSGEMPYRCNICDKTFTFQQSYHKHRLYHKDDKPHTCTTCGRSFKELSTLHNHERIHTGEKPFACETCGKCFRQRVSYLVHRRIHTGVMPYKCTACGKCFRYKVSQRTHKCTAQPPGTVVRQSSDLVQRLLQVSQIKDSSSSDGGNTNKVPSSSETETSQVQCIANEENRYILIINNLGQHVLTRQSEVEGKRLKEEVDTERKLTAMKYEERNDETFIRDLWGHNILNGTTLKDSMEISVRSGLVESEQELLSGDGKNDFFSMGLSSSTENEVRSPSNEMEHLRLSSPTSSETIVNNVNQTSSVELHSMTNDFQCGMNGCHDIMIQQDFVSENSTEAISSSTINEESLKQLLYGNTETHK